MRRCVSLVLGLLVLPALVWGQAQVINGNRVHAGWVNYGITAGTATAYTLTFTPALQGYAAGQCFLLKPHLTNTGAATLNVQALGAKALRKLSGGSLVPLVAGDLLVGRLMQACYDGTDLQLMGAAPDASGGLADADKGDVTVTGAGTVWTIDPGAVTYGKLPPASAARRLLGRGEAAGAGAWQEVTLGAGLTMSGTTLNTVSAGDAGIVCDGVTNVTTAIQTLLDTVPLGTKVVLPGGSCMTNQPLTIARSIALQGAGQDLTYVKQTVTNLPVLLVTSGNVHLGGMTLMHATNPVAGGDGLIVRKPDGGSLNGVFLTDVSASWNWRGFVLGCMAYGMASQVVAQKNNSHGFEFRYETDPGCGVDQWDILHGVALLNVGVGFYGNNTSYAFGLGPFLWNTSSFGNNQGGYMFTGSPGHPINDLRFHDILSSADNGGAIFLDTYGGSHIITNPWIEYAGSLAGFPIGFLNTTSVASQTGHCLGLTENNDTTTITGGLYWNCAWSGVALYAPYTTMTGGVSRGNGQALDASLARRAGVAIGGTGVHLSGHSFMFPTTTTLNYIHLGGTIDNLSIGVNTYSNDLSPQNFLANQATLTNLRLPVLAAGVILHTNTAAAPGLQLYDASQGPTPVKLVRVADGQLQILSAAGATVIQSLSDAGTPGWPTRRGQATMIDGNASVNVGLSGAEPDTGYFVQLTVASTGGGPAPGALTVSGVTKSTTGFEVFVSAAPGVGKSVTYDWLVHR